MTRPVAFTQHLGDGRALSHVFAAAEEPDRERILHGSEIHAGNVGVVGAGYSYDDLAPIGDMTLTEKWLTAHQDGDRIWRGPCEAKADPHWHFERWDVSGRVRVSVDDAHVRWCRISTGGTYPLCFFRSTSFDADHVGLIAEWLEVAGPPSQRLGIILSARRPDSALVRRCHIHGHSTGAQVRTGNRFVNCLVSGVHYFSGSHNTAMSNHGGPSGAHSGIVGCRLMTGNSASLSLYTDYGSVTDVEIRDCYLAPDRANYALRAGEDTTNGDNHQGNRDIVITGNVFGRDFQRFSGSSLPAVQWNPDRPGAVWEGNRWGARGPHWQPGDPEEGDPVTG